MGEDAGDGLEAGAGPGEQVLAHGQEHLAPVLGAASYFVLGVNRIRRRAQALRLPEVRARIPEELRPPPPHQLLSA